MSSSTELHAGSGDLLGSSFSSSFSVPPLTHEEREKLQPTERGATDASKTPQLIIGASENKNENAPQTVESVTGGRAQDAGSALNQEDPSAVSNDITNITASQVDPEEEKRKLEAQLTEWRKESAEARVKAESTRLRIEEENRKKAQEEEEKKKAQIKKRKQEEEEAEIKRKLEQEIGTSTSTSGSAHRSGLAASIKRNKEKETKDRKRWQDVKEAWEIVNDGQRATSSSSAATAASTVSAKDDSPSHPVDEGVSSIIDARDTVAGDNGGRSSQGPELFKRAHAPVQAEARSDGTIDPTPASASRRSDILSSSQTSAASSYVHVDKREEVASAWQSAADTPASDTTRSSTPLPSSSATQQQQEKSVSSIACDDAASTSKAQEYPPSFPSTLPGDIESVGHAANDGKGSSNRPPSQPPSLTLSLFTLPTHRSLLRITAVLGINLVLPFINGVMLGFGEIFARETVQWARRWWRGEVRFSFGSLRGSGGPGSNAARVGLHQGMQAGEASFSDPDLA